MEAGAFNEALLVLSTNDSPDNSALYIHNASRQIDKTYRSNMNTLQVFAISPKHTTLDFTGGWTIENKIDVFAARVEGWQIGIAKEMINNKIPHRGFALLHIVFSYFEMIGKYIHGYIGNDKSKFYFAKGIQATLEVSPTEEAFLKALYSSVRNGLYHLGMTKINVMLRDDIPSSIGFDSERNILAICPDRLVEDLDIRFHDYVSELRNPKSEKLRENFEKRFDYDNSEISL